MAILSAMSASRVHDCLFSQSVGVITETDKEIISYMLSDAIAPSTRAGYIGKGLPVWRSFLKSQRMWTDSRLASDAIVGLQEASASTQDKVQLFILYAHFLKTKGVEDCSIHFKALAHDLRSLGYCEVADLLHSKPVMIARQFGARDNVRKVIHNKISNQKEAVSGEMMAYLQLEYWQKAVHSTDSLVIDKAVTCVICWCLFEWGLRVGNLTKTASDKQQLVNRHQSKLSTVELRDNSTLELDQHVIRANEVMVEYAESNRTKQVTAFQYSKRYQSTSVAIAITILLVSSKSNQTGDRRVIYRVENTSVGHQTLIEMLDTFIKFAHYDSEADLFFSRVSSSRLNGTLVNSSLPNGGTERKRYRQSDVNTLVKECAEHFRLDPNTFSSKSFKNGGITTTKLNSVELGLSGQQVAAQFDHKTVSANRMYQRIGLLENKGNGPLKFMGNDKVYNHKNLKLLGNIKKVTTPKSHGKRGVGHSKRMKS